LFFRLHPLFYNNRWVFLSVHIALGMTWSEKEVTQFFQFL
jgi:hypothetical protein